MAITELSASIRSGTDPAVLQLRREGFGYAATADVTDEFDPRSCHVVLANGDEIAGAVRITRSPPSVLEAWSGGRLNYTKGWPHTADISRAAIADSCRSLGLYKLLMSLAVLEAEHMGIAHLFGVVATDHAYLLNFWERIGAEQFAGPDLFQPRGCEAKSGQPIHVDVKKSSAYALEIFTEISRELAFKGVQVDAGLFAVPA